MDGAVTVLLLLVGAVLAVAVPAPENVTVSCQNLRTTVSWKYRERQPQTGFIVYIESSDRDKKANTTDQQYDLSNFVWENEDHYMAYYAVNVTAVQGSSKSAPAQSTSFSFNAIRMVDRNCPLDFPPVNLTSGDSGATVSFQNPFHFYEELRRATKADNAFFEFSTNPVKNGSRCNLKQDICRVDFWFPEGVEECVRLKGQLYDGTGVNHVVFRETDPICVTESSVADVHLVLFLLLLCGFVLLSCFVTMAICKVRAWTMRKESPPKPLIVENHKERHNTADNGKISLVTIEEKEEEDNGDDDSGTHLVGKNLARSLYAMQGRLQYQEAVRPMSEGHRTDEDSADDSLKTVCFSIQEDEEAVPFYDRPHVLQVELGDGVMVEGYTERLKTRFETEDHS